MPKEKGKKRKSEYIVEGQIQTKKWNWSKFCFKCEREMPFKYNRLVRHSECRMCGWRHIPTVLGNYKELARSLDDEGKKRLKTYLEKRKAKS